MRRCFVLAIAFALAAAAAASAGAAPAEDAQALQRTFLEGVRLLEAGDAQQAEAIFREMLRHTDSPRVKLELARALYVLGRYEDSKRLFQEVSRQADTPWRVRDNIAQFVGQIEERTGYLKFGVTFVSDSNPRNLAAQKEFSIGDLRLTPTEAPKKMTGLRYSARGWLPLEESPNGAAGYLAASYTDLPGSDFDRLTVDAGLSRGLGRSGTLRGKAGLELGAFGGKLLYAFPYVGADSILDQSRAHRLAGEAKLGRIVVPDLRFQDATYASGALSVRYLASDSVTATLRVGAEVSSARERPYSYHGWDVGPGLSWLWAQTACLVGASASLGSRKYAGADPFFGVQREDAKAKLELTLGNKEWRWRDNHLVLIAALQKNRSNIEFYRYRKASLSVSVE